MYKFLPILLFAYGLAVISDEIYDNSYALIIGIDKYEYVMDLNYAINDAQSVQLLLVNDFEFKEENTILLLDEYAPKDGILSSLSNILGKAEKNDIVIIFFAGHGETLTLPNGMEIGYLIPVDGDINFPFSTGLVMDNVSTISMLSKSKHMLFLRDACYSGLMAEGSRGLDKIENDAGYINSVSNISAR